MTSRRQLKGHYRGTVDCIIADKSSTRTMKSSARPALSSQPRNRDAIARSLPPVNLDRTTRATTPTRYPTPLRTFGILSTALGPASKYQQPRTSSTASCDYPSVQFPILRYPVTAQLKLTAPATYKSSYAIHGLVPTPITSQCVPLMHPRIRPAASTIRRLRTFDVAEDLRCPKPLCNATCSAQFNCPQIFQTFVPGANDRPFATQQCTRRSITPITTLIPDLVSSTPSFVAHTPAVSILMLRYLQNSSKPSINSVTPEKSADAPETPAATRSKFLHVRTTTAVHKGKGNQPPCRRQRLSLYRISTVPSFLVLRFPTLLQFPQSPDTATSDTLVTDPVLPAHRFVSNAHAA